MTDSDLLDRIAAVISAANAHDASTNDPNTAWDALHKIDMLVMGARFQVVASGRQRIVVLDPNGPDTDA